MPLLGGHLSTSVLKNLAPAIKASLHAKLERLLSRPLIANIVGAEPASNGAERGDVPGIFLALQDAARPYQPTSSSLHRKAIWRENPDDGTCSILIGVDYDDLWRGCEKEVLDTVASTIESDITFLTEEQKLLLERSPREFLALQPRPESAELAAFERDNVGGSVRVVGLTFAAPPESRGHIRYVAIVPNLVQIQRQLDALRAIEQATDDGPLGPLRALIGLCDPASVSVLSSELCEGSTVGPEADERFDEHQSECLSRAMATPHFAVIQGPPGSGKTTVISGIVRRAVARGEQVLVVSPTHVAVDNVVEKLTPRDLTNSDDRLEQRSLPVRYAARTAKLSARALEYWIGSRKQRRGATIAKRVQQSLCRSSAFARALYAIEDKEAPGSAPLSSAIARVQTVICGTPIGILSFDPVKNSQPGSFGLLIVDEVSKMTLSEFLAIAVKAKRWVLVGDPAQLPPFNNSEENATTLDDVLAPGLELVCSVGAILDRVRPPARPEERLVVVARDPAVVSAAISAHLRACWPDQALPAAPLSQAVNAKIIVCRPEEVERACQVVSPVQAQDRNHNPEHNGSIRILIERGLAVPRPKFASGMRFVEARARAQAQIFDNSFNVYHARPWSERGGRKLQVVMFRNALDKYLPSRAALAILPSQVALDPDEMCSMLTERIAERLAVNTISVYDWLTGIPTEYFDVSPLRELGLFSSALLRKQVRRFVGVLKKQYRMHASLSQVPRELFYFGEALHDSHEAQGGCRVRLVQVDSTASDGESNEREAEMISTMLTKLNVVDSPGAHRPSIMIITPYRKQEALLERAIEDLRHQRVVDKIDIEICTLDRCQGREADYVLISLVRRRASTFLDMPKRWNVALTRAMQGLFIIGDINAYLEEAAAARQRARAQSAAGNHRRVPMSLPATFIEAYDRQISDSGRPGVR